MWCGSLSATRRLIFVISIRRSIPTCRDYNQIYNNIGTEDRAQAQAFTDTWTWDDHANQCYEEILSNKNGVQTQQSIALINGLEKVLGKCSLSRLNDRPHGWNTTSVETVGK